MHTPSFLIAADSFKNCLSALEVGKCIRAGIHSVFPQAKVTVLPMADGGEGTVDTILFAKGGTKEWVISVDPLNRPINSFIGILSDKNTAIIEMAATSGLELLLPKERNPMITSTFGTGLLIKAALDKGCQNIIIGIGGSATNDGGVGMAKALGILFLDQNGNEIDDGGAAIRNLHNIDISNIDRRIFNVRIRVASDVTNVICGKNGASYIYGKQKGATKKMAKELDQALVRLTKIVEEKLHINIEKIKGGGAAGGLGAGLVCFLGASIESGFDMMAKLIHLEQEISRHQIIITAEGSFDSQSFNGKTTFGIANLVQKTNKPVYVLAGSITDKLNEDDLRGIAAIIPITKKPTNLTTAIKNAPVWLYDASVMLSSIIKNTIQ